MVAACQHHLKVIWQRYVFSQQTILTKTWTGYEVFSVHVDSTKMLNQYLKFISLLLLYSSYHVHFADDGFVKQHLV